MVGYWIDGFTNSIIQNAIHMCAQAKMVELLLIHLRCGASQPGATMAKPPG